jgi:hypothetical protein
MLLFILDNDIYNDNPGPVDIELYKLKKRRRVMGERNQVEWR